jgi:hypothetical protein
MAVQDEGLVVALLASREKKISGKFDLYIGKRFCRLGLMLNCLVSQAFVFSSATKILSKKIA